MNKRTVVFLLSLVFLLAPTVSMASTFEVGKDSKINFVFQSLTTISFKIWPNMKPYTCKLWSVFTLGFSDRTLQDLFGCMNFHENIGTRSSINASCCWMLLTRSKSLKRPYD